MKFCLFAHSWISDWNHGNAHFLRGLAQELIRMGHEVRCYEDVDSWSKSNLLRERTELAESAIGQFRATFPDLDVRFYEKEHGFEQFAADELRNCDVVLVHEWNPPQLVNTLLSLKRKLGFLALFHDTHHRAYTAPREILQINLREFDGVLAFGEAIRRIYLAGFGVRRAWTFHEAADTAHFQPLPRRKSTDVVWVGNWGDEERTRELEEFLIGPASRLGGKKFAAHGVRYPKAACARLDETGIEYRGYLPNLQAPYVYGESAITLHVPRRFYANGLSGIPTIRVFEALACGIPLLCAPWSDVEGLFKEGEDYLCVPDGSAMEAEIRHLLGDEKGRIQFAEQGVRTIRAKHTCLHRAQQLMGICEELAQ